MKDEWKLAEAKNKLSEVVNQALDGKPQAISKRNDSVVVISKDEYQKMTEPRESFIDFLMSAPPLDELDLARDSTSSREVIL